MPLISPGETWVALGDSITEDPYGYVGICAAKLPGVKVLNAGVGGNKARDMRARLDGDVLRHRPNLVTVSVGVNDVWHGFYDYEHDRPAATYNPAVGEPIDEYRSDLTFIIDAIAAIGSKVLLVSPTMIGEVPETRENKLLATYVEAMKVIAAEKGVSYCPMNESIWDELAEMRESQPDACITTDGVHMTSRGAKLMAETLLRAFEAS